MRGRLSPRGTTPVPNGSYQRVLALTMLGQNNVRVDGQDADGPPQPDHHGFEPISIVYRSPRPPVRGSLEIVWSSDTCEPSRRPPEDGAELAYGGPTETAFTVRAGAPELESATHAAILEAAAEDPAEAVVIRTRTPVIWGGSRRLQPGRPPGAACVSAEQIIGAAFTRWFNDARWTADGGRRDLPRVFPEGVDLRRELTGACAMWPLAAPKVESWHVNTFAETSGTSRGGHRNLYPAERFHVLLRCGSTDPVLRQWFTALLEAAAITSFGRSTVTGAGAIEVVRPREGAVAVDR